MKKMILSLVCISALALSAKAETHTPTMTVGTGIEHAAHSVVVGDAVTGNTSAEGHHLTVGQVQGMISVLSIESGIEGDLSDNLNLRFYPNPTPRDLFIEHNSENALTINIISLDGKNVMSVMSEESLVELNLESLPVGIYVLNISSENQLVKSAKIIKE